jgi:hypothetical protein
MAKYLFEAHYTAEGTKGLAREGGSGRREAVTRGGGERRRKVGGLLLRVR